MGSGFMNHPWATVWFNPSATIRRVTDSGRGYDPALVSAVWGLSSGVFFAAQPERIFPVGMKPFVVSFFIVVGTLLMTGVIYMNGALRAWGGRKVGGKATTSELSEALALSGIPFVSYFALWAVVAISIRLIYGDSPPASGSRPAPLWLYPILGLGAVLFVWSEVLRKYCILEVQGFSAAQGRRAFWTGMNRFYLLLAAAAVLLVFAPLAVSRILQLFRG